MSHEFTTALGFPGFFGECAACLDPEVFYEIPSTDFLDLGNLLKQNVLRFVYFEFSIRDS